eukprot:768792-Hanusia_phi.AAC.4
MLAGDLLSDDEDQTEPLASTPETYIFSVHVMQRPQTFRRKNAELAALELTADELFGGQEEVGDLKKGMFDVVLQRLSDLAGFVCRSFEYRRYEHGKEATVLVKDEKTLNECFEYMEDSFPVLYTLDIDLIPLCKFVLRKEGQSETQEIEISANELTWSQLRSEIRFSIGKDFNVKALEHGETTDGFFITAEKSFDKVLDMLFTEGSRFKVHLLLVPSSSFCQMDMSEESSIDGGQGAELSWEIDCLSALHLQGYEDEKVDEIDIDSLPMVGSFAARADDKWNAVCSKLRQIPWIANNHSRIPLRVFLTFGGPPRSMVKEIGSQKDWESIKKSVSGDPFFDGRCCLILLSSAAHQAVRASNAHSVDEKLKKIEESDAPAVKREPLDAFLLMCYEGDDDPIRLRLQVRTTKVTTSREFDAKLNKIFGDRAALCFWKNSGQACYVKSEDDWRAAIDDVQRSWSFGVGDGALHAAVVSEEDGHLFEPSSSEYPRVEPKDERYLTQLHVAARDGNTNLAKQLIHMGETKDFANSGIVNRQDKNGATALHYASFYARIDMLEFLLKHGAKVNVQDSNGKSPLHSAGHEACKLLVQSKARLNARDHAGWTPLHAAAAVDNAKTATLLVKMQADIDAPSNLGWAPIHVASRYDSQSVISLLIAAECNILLRTNDLHLAVELSLDAGKKVANKELKDATNLAMASENVWKREQHSNVKSSEFQLLARGLVKMIDGRDSKSRARGEAAGADIFSIFKSYDKNGNGLLSKAEFHAALQGPPFLLRYSDREKLHSYMDVDGDGNIDIEEFSSALFGRKSQTRHKEAVVLTVRSVSCHATNGMSLEGRSIIIAVDFMQQYRSGVVPLADLLQIGSATIPFASSDHVYVVNHTQKFSTSFPAFSRNRELILEAIKDREEFLRAEVILFKELINEQGELVMQEVGSGVVSLVSDTGGEDGEEAEHRIGLYVPISSPHALPRRWQDATRAELLILFRRIPISVQRRLKGTEQGGIPSREQLIEVISGWESEQEVSLPKDKEMAKVLELEGKRRRQTLDPFAEASFTLKAMHVLDSLVIEVAKEKGIKSMSQTWQNRWNFR